MANLACSDTLIQIDHLCVEKGNKSLINDVSFSISRGEFVGLIGPNGAGKSTLLRCLYRYFQPSSGNLLFQGKPIEVVSLKQYAKQVAVVLQEVGNDFNLAVVDVILMGLTPHKPLFSNYTSDDRAKVMQSLNAVGLALKASQSYSSLSGGERQRVMIAKAMVQQPELLIMDEPTSHLDVKYQIQIMELAKAMNVTVIASFHDLNLAGALCERILVLKSGELIANGCPIDVLTNELLSAVFGVCAEVDILHSGSKAIPHIRYHYGYI
ncbi:ABC transporter ATP-binding protein [Pseudoalteromonas xiamenensis]|uniref:ABC transporter ATP-binding protein n=1 Tax=Pseudoalteromonas xiamenensis TaxID=882626 RepID=UPI0027E490A3|nr:ABC transporter ATP-binding protein [Pseudoalteromonas xiamenensis]WMN59185.1 ABC transporter ATP-binding protein [Pseudoalteromonas xiamenensis]